MNIFITHFYTRDNRGDAAILTALIQQLHSIFTLPQLVISTMEGPHHTNVFSECPTTKSFMQIAIMNDRNKYIKVFHIFYTVLISTLWTVLYRMFGIKTDFLLSNDLKFFLHYIVSADLIILVGGGYLRGTANIFDNINYFLLVYPLFLERLLGKKVILHSQSIGPFATAFQRFLTKKALGFAKLILVRENISMQLLQKIGIQKKHIKKSVDAGFLYETDKKVSLQQFGVRQTSEVVGITVAKKWLFDQEKQQQYEEQIIRFCKKVVHAGYEIVFIPQVTSPFFTDDDRDVARRICKNIGESLHVVNIENDLPLDTIKAIYAELDYIIGLRFHSVIFALTSFVPAIAIEYEHKTRGIMNDLGMSEWVIKIEEVEAERLYTLFEKLTIRKHAYKDALQSVIPLYIAEAEKANYYIKTAYYGN